MPSDTKSTISFKLSSARAKSYYSEIAREQGYSSVGDMARVLFFNGLRLKRIPAYKKDELIDRDD